MSGSSQRAPYFGAAPQASTHALYQRLETLLAGGGDGRLALSRPEQKNAYGCTPYPRSRLLDFASSTASTISEQAYAAAQEARAQLLADAATLGVAEAFEASVEKARAALTHYLGIAGTEVIFSPSGSDAQLQALGLVRTLLGTPLVSIIVGSDQTGGFTQYTSRGQHFRDGTAEDSRARKGAPITGLAEGVRSVGIPFCDEAGNCRGSRQMDDAVIEAVRQATGKGEKVLLQIMDSSKLGRRAPSAACLSEILAAWPGKVQIVVDACQMRLGRARLSDYLARDFLVLMTGSKFFTGPAFSGALLVPPGVAEAMDTLTQLPEGLAGYSTRFDWPTRWPALRASLPDTPNYGQWLRWEAALEEIRTYFAVPRVFRTALLKEFAARVPPLIQASGHLSLLAGPPDSADQDASLGTIISFTVRRGGGDISADESASLYRAMSQDLAARLPDQAGAGDRLIAARLCQIGQPVAFRHGQGAALRLCSSARLVTRCWSRGAASVEEAFAPELADIALVIEKLDWLANNPQLLAQSPAPGSVPALSAAWDQLCTPRTGLARLTRLAFTGGDLSPLWGKWMEAASDDRAGSGMAMDLSVIAQLWGNKPAGLAIQDQALGFQRLYSSPCDKTPPRLRVLALAAVTDIGGNTPLEFLLEDSGIALATYYVVPGKALPDPMPDHDVAIVAASDADNAALAAIEKLLPAWPRPVLNHPQGIKLLERDSLHHRLAGIPGLEIPATARLDRAPLIALAAGQIPLQELLEGGSYPLIIRPIGSHAGFGLEKIAGPDGLADYLEHRPEQEFFLSSFVDYASSDGHFRKYRLVVVGDKPYACHMAIAEEWKVWYLNADMAVSVPHRMEEAMFMHDFDTAFAARHAHALKEMIARIGLDYFAIDCAETSAGALLIFEADNTAIVHDMDPPSVYPYKSAQMRKIFQAMQAMLCPHGRRMEANAA